MPGLGDVERAFLNRLVLAALCYRGYWSPTSSQIDISRLRTHRPDDRSGSLKMPWRLLYPSSTLPESERW